MQEKRVTLISLGSSPDAAANSSGGSLILISSDTRSVMSLVSDSDCNTRPPAAFPA